VPGPKVVGVVALIGVSCGLPEVVEVSSCPFGVVLVISGAGPGARLELAPGRVVALGKVFGRPLWVGVVAQGEDRAIDATDESGRCLVVLPCAVGDVARCDDDLPGRRSRGSLRSAAKGEEDRDEGHDDYCRGPTGFDVRCLQAPARFPRRAPLPFLICVTDAGHTDPSERLIASCSHPVIWD
jgi:hypothetical protein